MSNSVERFGTEVKKQARRTVGDNVFGRGLDTATDIATGATSQAVRFFENQMDDVTGRDTKKSGSVSGKTNTVAKPPVRIQEKNFFEEVGDRAKGFVEDPVGAVTGAVRDVVGGVSDVISPLLPNTGGDTTNEVFRDVQEGRIKRSSGEIDSAFEKDPFAYDPQTTLEMRELSEAGKDKEVKSIMEKYELGEGIYGLRRKALDMSKKARGTILTPTFMNNVTGEGGSVLTRG